MEPAFLSRSMTADGRHVVAWSTGSISPSRLVANYRGAHKGPARHHDADAKAALQLIEIAGAVDLVDLIAAIPGTRERWRNRVAGGELPTASQALAECDHCRSFRLTHADPNAPERQPAPKQTTSWPDVLRDLGSDPDHHPDDGPLREHWPKVRQAIYTATKSAGDAWETWCKADDRVRMHVQRLLSIRVAA